MSEIAIRVKNLSKCYEIYNKPQDRLKQAFSRSKKYFHEFWALHDVSFEIKKGEALGIVGRNGSGKSTLLQLICGTLTPTSGEIKVNGRIAALLELGAGFNPEFTGRENVYMNGAILGFSKGEIDAKFDEIAAFADIGEFIEQPVKTYSSGMFVRLAFAVQACIEPDILIVDEALSVGDIFFQQKCATRIQELLKKGTTVLFVTHDLHSITTFCKQALLLSEGKLIKIGEPKEVLEYYTAVLYGYSAQQSLETNIRKDGYVAAKINFDNFDLNSLQSVSNLGITRYGEGAIQFQRFALLDFESKAISQFTSGENLKLVLELTTNNKSGLIPNVGFQIRDRLGNIACGTNLWMLGAKVEPQEANSNFYIVFDIKLMLGAGAYTITVAVSDYSSNPMQVYDWIDQVATFDIISKEDGQGRVGGYSYCPVNLTGSILLSSTQ